MVFELIIPLLQSDATNLRQLDGHTTHTIIHTTHTQLHKNVFGNFEQADPHTPNFCIVACELFCK